MYKRYSNFKLFVLPSSCCVAVGGLCRVAEFCAHGMISRASYFFLFRSGLVLAFQLMFLFRIEVLSTGATYHRVAVCKMARASCPVGRLRVRSHLYGRGRERTTFCCANCNALRGCVFAWVDGIGFVAPALEGLCYFSYLVVG